MAWFRAMGVTEVAYHEATVLGREDDHPGRALAYYGSRGETPLRWGGAGAASFGLAGEVTPEAYEAAFGPGGFRLPGTGEPLVRTRRPGFELVVGAHKTVAVLGVAGDAESMHSIIDVETAATMAWLDDWFQVRGGRRGRVQARTATAGLTYAVTRHATSRAGDPAPHDHVLVANVVEMLDDVGGCKALDSAALRDTVEAATMVGRLHSAARAVELGFRIEPDDGPTGRLRHWRIVGVPDEVCALFSKRSNEIAEHLAASGQDSYRARGVAARQTRSVKRHTGPDDLLAGWHAEVAAAGWPLERLVARLEQARDGNRGLPFPLTDTEIDRIAVEVLDIDGDLLASHKVFTRTQLIAEVAPRLYGRDPRELDRVIDRIAARRDVIPLIRVAAAREQTYTTAAVLEAEHTIARTIEALADRPGLAIEPDRIAHALAAKEQAIGRPLSPGQRRAVERLCRAESAVSVVVGVAGSGKTTALDAATDALEAAGYRVLGTSTSGQAARTLGEEADIEARTLASLLWRIDHGHAPLDARTSVIVDEASMADDADLARLTLAIERAGGHLVLVGDHRQLSAVGPGGALHALLGRRPEIVVRLEENVRQRDRAERRALAALRDGSVPHAVAWYARAGRIHTAPTRLDTLLAMTGAWAGDLTSRHTTALLAWRRQDVADLNRLARAQWADLGRLDGEDIAVGGRWYAVGDKLVALAPNPDAGIVTSEPLTVEAVDANGLTVSTHDGRTVHLTGEAIDPEHLDYGYALTVHRAQGATYDRAHVLAAGGGRELAYVALSRARDRTDVHAVADNLAQAVDDLQADWGVERHQRWITDTRAVIGHDPAPLRPSISDRLRALGVDRDAIEELTSQRLRQAELDLLSCRRNLGDLHRGGGRWVHRPEGNAAVALHAARAELDEAERHLHGPKLRRRDRRSALARRDAAHASVAAAEAAWRLVGEPVVSTLETAIDDAAAEVRRLSVEHTRQLLDRSNERSLHREWELSRAAEHDTPGIELGR
jgi:conjugative relaxase-like TrwC/TraI family protein